jgi:hypothetical protein
MTRPSHNLAEAAPDLVNQRGYALLSVILLGALLLLAAMTASLNVYTQGRREKEQETIWRGNQYVRAIRLYYRKKGKFPTTLDDLTKQEIGQPRFIRQAYKDPMNKQDGSWRLIYVTPTGQLIGSVMSSSLQGAAGVAPSTSLFGQPAGGQQTASTQPQNSNQPSSNQSQANASNAPAGGNAGAAAPGAPSSSGTAEQSDSNTNPIIGGNIIGVGSKVKQPSLMVYHKGTTYYQWEFIWNPLQSNAAPAGSTGTPGISQPGSGQTTSPPGSSSGTGTQTIPNTQPQIDH